MFLTNLLSLKNTNWLIRWCFLIYKVKTLLIHQIIEAEIMSSSVTLPSARVFSKV